MRRVLVIIGAIILLAILVISCNKEQAVDNLMENKAIVTNIMTKMWQDPEMKSQLVEKVMSDLESYGRIMESTLSDSTKFAALMEKVAGNEELKKQVIGLADAWKKEASKASKASKKK